MGTFRIILAIAVFMAHATHTHDGGAFDIMRKDFLPIYVWSGTAVFAFFVISGFYISMVIDRKYSKLDGGTGKFYLNRALRLYPTNWVILALYFAYCFATGIPSFLTVPLPDGADWWARGLATFSNVFFLGSEVVTFNNPANWRFMVSPQAWSLSVEMYFYLLAPFIVMRSMKAILALTAAFFAFRMGLVIAGFAVVPWRYFFFPSVFVLFLMGVLSYRLYKVVKDEEWARYVAPIAIIVLFGQIIYKPLWIYSDVDHIVPWLFYISVMLCTPFVFLVTKDNAIDNFLGQLAFPIYIAHRFILHATVHYYDGPVDQVTVAFVVLIAVCVAIYLAVDRPIEKIRRAVSQGRALRPQTEVTAPVI